MMDFAAGLADDMFAYYACHRLFGIPAGAAV